MDPYETLNLETETSLLIMQELIARGVQVTWLEEHGIGLRDGHLHGETREVLSIEPFRLGSARVESLDQYDALLPRIDPPVDADYVQATQLLDFLSPHVVQFNPARALRTFNEKLIPLMWPQFTPPTLVSREIEEFTAFFSKHRDIILKPLNECSGRGIKRLQHRSGRSFRRQIEEALGEPRITATFMLAQKFLPGVQNGDKRVFLLDGEPLGAVNRIPKDPHSLANIHQGAMCEATSLSGRELQVLRAVGPFLRQENILLAGVDFIDGYLTEVNITSPSALRQINAVSGTSLETVIVDAMLDRIADVRLRYLGKSA
jgi:glutathione synthase